MMQITYDSIRPKTIMAKAKTAKAVALTVFEMNLL